MNDIEENREKLRDLALQHIEPSSKIEEIIAGKPEDKVEGQEQEVEEEEDSDTPSANSHNTISERKYKRGGRRMNTFVVDDKNSEDFEYIQPTTTKNDGDAFDPVLANEGASVDDDGGLPTQRKHQRGGRKNKRSNRQDLDSQIPWSQRNGRLRSPYSEEEEEEPRMRQKPGDSEPEVREKVPTPFETGLKHFNMRRAEHSGAKPIGISLDRGEKTNGTHTKKEKKTKKRSKKKGKNSKRKGESSSEESSSESESESESEEEENDKAKKKKQKPFAIRLDLNLEIEIFLRAKIKGEITISFLE